MKTYIVCAYLTLETAESSLSCIEQHVERERGAGRRRTTAEANVGLKVRFANPWWGTSAALWKMSAPIGEHFVKLSTIFR